MKKASAIKRVINVCAIASLFGISACVPIPITGTEGAKPGSIKVGKTTVSDVQRKSGLSDYATPDQRFFVYSYHRESGVFTVPAGPWDGPVEDLFWTVRHGHSRLLVEFDDSEVVVNRLIHRCKKHHANGICDQPASKSIWTLIAKLHGDEYATDYSEKMARITPPPELVPLNAAAFGGDTARVRSLIQQGADANDSDQYGNTALHIAANYGNFAVVDTLLPMIHDLNTGNRWGHTALHYAAKQGHIEILQLLISNGAEVNQQNVFGSTPLHAAAQIPSTAPAKLLLAAGADPHIRDDDGLLPIDVAKQRQNKQVSRVLNTLTHQH